MSIFDIILTIAIIVLIVFVLTLVKGKRGKVKDKTTSLYTTALNHMLHGEDETAIKCFKEIAKKDTENIDAYIKLGILFRKTGKLKNAVKIHQGLLYRQGISKDQRLEILRNIVEDYISLEEKSKALSSAEDILELDKRNIWAFEKLQNLHRDLEQWDKAAWYLRKVLSLRRESNSRLLALYKVQGGLEKFNEGAYHDARLIFRKAIKIDPECETPYFYIAESYIKDHRGEEAIKWWEKFANASPEKAHLIFNPLQKVLFSLGNFGKIENFYENILSKKPGDIRTIAALAGFYERKGDVDKAITLVEELIEKNPDSRVAKIALSKLLIAQGKGDEASEILNELLEKIEVDIEIVCSNCGHKERSMLWLCPVCGQIDTFLDQT